MRELDPAALETFRAEHPDAVLLDVREQAEYDFVRFDGAVLIPLMELPGRLEDALPRRDVPVVVCCHHGIRSMQAAMFLEHSGYEDVYNLSGGIDRYAMEVDSGFPRY